MKHTILFIITLFFIISCEKNYDSRKSVDLKIENFKLKNTSIRAIEIVNDSTLVYAGSKGDFGVISKSGKINTVQKIKTDSITPHFRALAFTNKALFTLSVGNPALLYKYENNKTDLVYKEVNEKVFYDSMKFFDDLNGIAIGDPTDDCLSVLITRDGGNSWGKIACENLPKLKKGEAAFAASNTNIAIVGSNAWVVTGGKKARVFHTPDKGLTWSVAETPIVQGGASTGIYSVDFYNEKQGIICGGDYTNKFGNVANKAITSDGGKTWRLVAENESPKYVSCVQYVPNTQGKEVFAVSTNGIFYSNDSGKHWTKKSNQSFYSIRIVSKQIAWLSGDQKIARMIIQ